ncbi:MAG: hypothetical protein ACOZB3_02840 [Calditrichota bacterium]
MRKLNCFVACAFGHDDVDEFSKNNIEPILKTKNIKLLRVDRINHNKDIDDKIIELINECDFCIADLTYARPSVYYEAGRVHGLNKPVIFTARKDHFKDKPDDIHGNLRVHFDLQMKNIVSWPNKSFKKKLRSRIDLICRPIINTLVLDKQNLRYRKRYTALSLSEQRHRIYDLSTRWMKKLGFEDIHYGYSGIGSFVIANKLSTRKVHTIIVVFTNNGMRKNTLEIFQFHPNSILWFKDYYPKESHKLNVLSDVIFCSNGKTPITRIREALPQFQPIGETDSYHASVSENERCVSSRVHFIEKISSIPELGNSLDHLTKLTITKPMKTR